MTILRQIIDPLKSPILYLDLDPERANSGPQLALSRAAAALRNGKVGEFNTILSKDPVNATNLILRHYQGTDLHGLVAGLLHEGTGKGAAFVQSLLRRKEWTPDALNRQFLVRDSGVQVGKVIRSNVPVWQSQADNRKRLPAHPIHRNPETGGSRNIIPLAAALPCIWAFTIDGMSQSWQEKRKQVLRNVAEYMDWRLTDSHGNSAAHHFAARMFLRAVPQHSDDGFPGMAPDHVHDRIQEIRQQLPGDPLGPQAMNTPNLDGERPADRLEQICQHWEAKHGTEGSRELRKWIDTCRAAEPRDDHRIVNADTLALPTAPNGAPIAGPILMDASQISADGFRLELLRQELDGHRRTALLRKHIRALPENLDATQIWIRTGNHPAKKFTKTISQEIRPGANTAMLREIALRRLPPGKELRGTEVMIQRGDEYAMIPLHFAFGVAIALGDPENAGADIPDSHLALLPPPGLTDMDGRNFPTAMAGSMGWEKTHTNETHGRAIINMLSRAYREEDFLIPDEHGKTGLDLLQQKLISIEEWIRRIPKKDHQDRDPGNDVKHEIQALIGKILNHRIHLEEPRHGTEDPGKKDPIQNPMGPAAGKPAIR